METTFQGLNVASGCYIGHCRIDLSLQRISLHSTDRIMTPLRGLGVAFWVWYLVELGFELLGVVQSSENAGFLDPHVRLWAWHAGKNGYFPLSSMSAASPQMWIQWPWLFWIPSESLLNAICPMLAWTHLFSLIWVPKWKLTVSFKYSYQKQKVMTYQALKA